MSDDDSWCESADPGWANGELGEVFLGDARLERRLVTVAEALSGQPSFPINHASEDWAATKAAYRLFDNERVTPERILRPHRERTLERMRAEPVVLAVQDTSFFNYTSHGKTTGLGPIGAKADGALGLILHTTLAVTPAGLPLGVLTQKCWAREGYKSYGKKLSEIPIEDKESYRWVETLRDTAGLAVRHGSSMVVTVADRECDIYEFLVEAERLNAKYVVRACYDRGVVHPECDHLKEQLRQSPPCGTVTVEVPSERRKATLELRFTQAVLCPPGHIRGGNDRATPEVWAVSAEELDPPEGKKPLSWTLLTNVPVGGFEQASERLLWYRRRWSIEEFHKILKSGCGVEDCRLETAERLARYLSLFSVIAWRLFWMTHIRRATPEAPAETVMTRAEIGTLTSLRRFQTFFADDRPSVKEVLTAVARLGGYLNRRNDPPPGANVLWRGWQRLQSMAELYESVRPDCG